MTPPEDAGQPPPPSQPPEITQAKVALRREARARRDALEIDDRLIWDEAIAERALALLLERGVRCVAGYWPMGSEVDPRPILVGLRDAGVATALPVTPPDESPLTFRAWTPWEPVEPGEMGTIVPSPSQPDVIPDAILAPMLAFDAALFRLGWGKGHYDRAVAALAARGATPLLIGLAYDAQRGPALPRAPHDHRLDALVLPSETIER